MTNLLRSLEIGRIAGRYRLDELLPEQARHPILTPLLRANPWRLAAVSGSRGERLRCALQDLGPVFVKFGQMLSTRRDLLPADIADELAKLQDQVPPFAAETAVSLIEASLGGKVDDLFARFDREPMMAQSMAM
jgi:ubiquinone biosynthesis protein